MQQTQKNIFSLGIDIGYSSISLVVFDSSQKIKYSKYLLHHGKITELLDKEITNLTKKYGEKISYGGVTGNGSRFLIQKNKAKFFNETAAIVEGSLYLNQNIKSIIEIGGQNAKFITNFSQKNQSQIQVAMNSECSAGTGSFLEEQASRLNIKLEDFAKYEEKAKSTPQIAGFCSVFTKTDITHLLQEGILIEDILCGLALAIARNYRGRIIGKLPILKPILFVGGVAHNQSILKALIDVLKIEPKNLIIPQHFEKIGAIGVALMARKQKVPVNLSELFNVKNLDSHNLDQIKMPTLKSFGQNDSLKKHCINITQNKSSKPKYFLGIDVGSTSTNLVLINEKEEIVNYCYLRTFGRPIDAIKQGFSELKKKINDQLEISGIGTTGSGRYLATDFLGVDLTKDEITAQAIAGLKIDHNVDTIFEIGGQDSKFISLKNESVIDFQMNKICAAGTGSFIEEQAKKLKISLKDFSKLALKSQTPVDLGQRCTVFMESSVGAHLSQGTSLGDIAAGLCYSIVRNYLHRVVGQKRIGKKIFLQGGIAHNQGIVNAFRSLTKKEIIVPPFFSVTGAYGVALLCKQKMNNQKSKFKGFEILNTNFVLQQKKQKKLSKAISVLEKLRFKNYSLKLDANKKTVGFPRGVFLLGMFPMFHTFFKELGFNVLLSANTNEKIVDLSHKYPLGETCYPVKLISGHVANLIEKKVDYIFLPSLHSTASKGSYSKQNFGCVYMQLLPKMIKKIINFNFQKTKFVSPEISFQLGKKHVVKTFLDMGKKLGKNEIQTQKALQKAMVAGQSFEKNLKQESKKKLAKLKLNEKVFVIICKGYVADDSVLNMKIPQKLNEMGYQNIFFYDLPESDLANDYPNLNWTFGKKTLEAAKIIREYSNFYAIYLTNNGCGADTALVHYFKEIMGEKPFLNIELDEHSSEVGIITRLEAFINSLKKENKEKNSKKRNVAMIDFSHLNKKKKLYLPYLFPYAEIFREILVKQNFNVGILPLTKESSIEKGKEFFSNKELFSATALLGDILKKIKNNSQKIAFFIPQIQETELHGQYAHLIKTKLTEKKCKNIEIVAPFLEKISAENLKLVFWGLLAGDIVKIAPRYLQKKYLTEVVNLVRNADFEIQPLKKLLNNILLKQKKQKNILILGDPLILFNDFLNNSLLKNLEHNHNYRVLSMPLSELVWLAWYDFFNLKKDEKKLKILKKLAVWTKEIAFLEQEQICFEENLENFIQNVHHEIGNFSGLIGRYCQAKLSGDLKVSGVITLNSAYENTKIALENLQKKQKPILNLSFDGGKNENNKTKIESFIYFLTRNL